MYLENYEISNIDLETNIAILKEEDLRIKRKLKDKQSINK